MDRKKRDRNRRQRLSRRQFVGKLGLAAASLVAGSRQLALAQTSDDLLEGEWILTNREGQHLGHMMIGADGATLATPTFNGTLVTPDGLAPSAVLRDAFLSNQPLNVRDQAGLLTAVKIGGRGNWLYLRSEQDGTILVFRRRPSAGHGIPSSDPAYRPDGGYYDSYADYSDYTDTYYDQGYFDYDDDSTYTDVHYVDVDVYSDN